MAPLVINMLGKKGGSIMKNIFLVVFTVIFTVGTALAVELIPVSKIGVDSDYEALMAIDIPTSTDDPRLSSKLSGWDWETDWCVGEDGNPIPTWSTNNKFELEAHVPGLNFWNMNNLVVSATNVDEDTQLPVGYSKQNVRISPERGNFTINIAQEHCYSGSPLVAYYDEYRQIYICGPVEGGGCYTSFNVAGKALISFSNYKQLRTINKK